MLARRPRFLLVEDVLALHARQIERYGGSDGIRDLGLLQSAVAMAVASFDGAYLHPTLEEMAAAHLFHLAQNHPFVDGNKRVAAVSMIVFLVINDLEPTFSEDELVQLTLGVASGKTTKSEAALTIAAHVQLRE
jgi:death-on-curing protein